MSEDFKWRHFAGDMIVWRVRWYCRYGISYRVLQEMMAKRGLAVDHTTLYRWVQHYAPELVSAERKQRLEGGRDIHQDQGFVKISLPGA